MVSIEISEFTMAGYTYNLVDDRGLHSYAVGMVLSTHCSTLMAGKFWGLGIT